MTACALAASGLALAKLPPLDEAAKAKAAETAAKAAWQAKVDAYKLCQVQDRIAAQYRKSGASRAQVNVPASATVQTAAAPAATAATAAPAAATPAAPATTPANATGTPAASQGGGTPVANVAAAPTIPPCSDPGPFAYHPPAQIPLETSGAHSPAANAATPPSVRPESAKMAPAGNATPQSKKP
ncbi:MAG TPA: hypothetical protein VEB23_03010 [Ramlibacter sp.]|nr:hypothetical protein [Ramlibacter sp.]